jgi:hypothetical protein
MVVGCIFCLGWLSTPLISSGIDWLFGLVRDDIPPSFSFSLRRSNILCTHFLASLASVIYSEIS